MQPNPISIVDIFRARQRISQYIRKTPLEYSTPLSDMLDTKIYMKMENQQVTGSFKIRGASNKVLSLSEEEKRRGVTTCSSGNHGRALSYISQKVGIKAVVCIPEPVPDNKREAIRNLGGELIVFGDTADEALVFADNLVEERGLTMVHAFDDPYTIAGQGTIGLELLEDLPDIDTLIIPLSGGSLLSGNALSLKSIKPSIRVIGVSQEKGPAMVRSLEAGKVVEIIEEPTIADGLAGGLGEHNSYTYELSQKLIDYYILVSEEEIMNAISFMLYKHNQIIEGAGAVGIAAILSGKVKKPGKNIAVVLSGGNIDTFKLLKIANQYPHQ